MLKSVECVNCEADQCKTGRYQALPVDIDAKDCRFSTHGHGVWTNSAGLITADSTTSERRAVAGGIVTRVAVYRMYKILLVGQRGRVL